MNNNNKNLPQINDEIIKELLSKYTDHTINGDTYHYVGKGGEGVIYKINNDDKVIKIYTKVEIDMIIKEFYVFGLLQELKGLNKNVVRMDKYYLSLSNPVIIMELMDGDLTKWCDMMVRNVDHTVQIMTNEEIDRQWLGMIFQVTYGLMFLNRLKILHTDTKSKNILYRQNVIRNNDLSDDKYDNFDVYKIRDTTYAVPNDYQFKISDFGAIQILGSKSNRMSDDEIINRIRKRDDLYELSRILYRVIVNYGINDYNWNDINRIIKQNKSYQEYYNQQKKHLETELSHVPQKVRDKMLLRSMIYYSIENDIIDKEEIIKKYSLRMPSSVVSDVLDKLTDTTIKNVFDLFLMLKRS